MWLHWPHVCHSDLRESQLSCNVATQHAVPLVPQTRRSAGRPWSTHPLFTEAVELLNILWNWKPEVHVQNKTGKISWLAFLASMHRRLTLAHGSSRPDTVPTKRSKHIPSWKPLTIRKLAQGHKEVLPNIISQQKSSFFVKRNLQMSRSPFRNSGSSWEVQVCRLHFSNGSMVQDRVEESCGRFHKWGPPIPGFSINIYKGKSY